MIKRILILSFLASSLIFCSKDACFECKKTNSTRGLCGEDARKFKKDMEKQGYNCKKVSEGK